MNNHNTSVLPLHKIWENTGFHRSVFSRMCTESTILPWYARIPVSEKRHSRIFCPVFATTKETRTEKKIDTIRKDAIFLKQNSLCNNIMRKTKTYLKRTNFCVHIFSRISWTLVISQNEIHAKFFLNGIRKNKFKPNIHKMHISRK